MSRISASIPARTAFTLIVVCLAAMCPAAAGQTSGKLYVGQRFGMAIDRYEVSASGIATLELSLSGFVIPAGITFSPQGEMFAVDVGSNAPGGTPSFIHRFLDPGGVPSANGTIGPLPWGHDVAFLSGELFMVQGGLDRIERFLFDGNMNPVANGEIIAGLAGTRARGIVANPATGELFVTGCCEINEINRYLIDAGGNVVPNGVISGNLSNPHGLALSSSDELFVANAGDNSVSRFIFDGAGTATWNGQITGQGLNVPLGVDSSPWGELFVTGEGMSHVARWTFDAAGNAVPNGTFALSGTGSWLRFVSNIDSDSDGLSDVAETNTGVFVDAQDTGTDPQNPDTDGDGLLDGTEVDMAQGTGCPSPLVADSDGDTLFDGYEVTVLFTNPCDVDTDGDGLLDDIDPNPTNPVVTTDELEEVAIIIADAIDVVLLGEFVGPNSNAQEGRRNSLATRVRNAAKAIAHGDKVSAIDLLDSVLARIDGVTPPPDWMAPGSDRDVLVMNISALIALLQA